MRFFRHERGENEFILGQYSNVKKKFFSRIKQFRRIVFKEEFFNFVSFHFIPLFVSLPVENCDDIYIYIELEQDIEEKASLGIIWNNVINPFRDSDVEIILEEKLKSIEELLIRESFKNKELEAI